MFFRRLFRPRIFRPFPFRRRLRFRRRMIGGPGIGPRR